MNNVYSNFEVPMTIVDIEMRDQGVVLTLEAMSGKVSNVIMDRKYADREFNEGVPNKLQVLTLQDHTGNVKAISPLNWYQLILQDEVGKEFSVSTLLVRAVFPDKHGNLHIRGVSNGMVDIYIKEEVYRKAFTKGLPSNSMIAALKDENENIINVSMILWTPVKQENPRTKTTLHGYRERTLDYRI